MVEMMGVDMIEGEALMIRVLVDGFPLYIFRPAPSAVGCCR